MRVALQLSGDEALVLFEWLAQREQKRRDAPLTAEDIALGRVLGQLEKTLAQPFDANYAHLVEAARKRIVDGS